MRSAQKLRSRHPQIIQEGHENSTREEHECFWQDGCFQQRSLELEGPVPKEHNRKSSGWAATHPGFLDELKNSLS